MTTSSDYNSNDELEETIVGADEDAEQPITQRAKRLKLALAGLNTDESVIIDVLAGLTNLELQQLKSKYADLFDSELDDDLSAEVGGFFEELCLALLETPIRHEIEIAHRALQRGTRYCYQLVEILLLKQSNQQIIEFKIAFNIYYGIKIDYVIKTRIRGRLQSFLLWLLNGGREELPDEAQAPDDAARLIRHFKVQEEFTSAIASVVDEEVADRQSDDEVAFEILSVRSARHLQFVFSHFEQRTEMTMERAITKAFRTHNNNTENADDTSDLVKCLLATVSMVRNPTAYFADKLHESFSASIIDDDEIISTFAQRKEIDISDINQQCLARHRHSLAQSTTEQCLGDYGKLLRALLEMPAVNRSGLKGCFP